MERGEGWAGRVRAPAYGVIHGRAHAAEARQLAEETARAAREVPPAARPPRAARLRNDA